LLCDNHMKSTRRLQKYIWWIPVLLGMVIGVLFGVRSVFAQYFEYDSNRVISPSEQCYVSPGQSVVEWKSGTTHQRCRESIAGICVWPIQHKHVTYKVTVNDGVPIRARWGRVIPAIDEQMMGWETYDSTSWNRLENNPYGRYEYSDFEPIDTNEYVVMVQTRYRLFNDVESTLGICTQQQ